MNCDLPLLQYAVSDGTAVDPLCASSSTFVLCNAGGEVSEDGVRVAFEVCTAILSSLQNSKDAVQSLVPLVQDFPAKAREVWGSSLCLDPLIMAACSTWDL